jgi:tetratricopeptide (TPR) repeat protein
MLDLLHKKRLPWAQLLIILVGILFYSNTLDVPFYLDDEFSIRDNSAIHLDRLSLKGIMDAGIKSPATTRPVVNISFALNYFFHQENVFGYHLINIFIHIITGLALFSFFRLTFKTPAVRSDYPSYHLIAFWAAILWCAHPIQTQSVTYVVQRMNSAAAMFYIIACWFYAKGRLSGSQKVSIYYFAGTAISWVLALGCKEISATLPVLLFFYEWIFFQKGKIAWFNKKAIYGVIVIFLFALVAGLYFSTNVGSSFFNEQGYIKYDFSLMERVLTESRILFYYISLLLLPVPSRLGLLHDFSLSTSLFQPLSTLLACIAIAIILFYAFAAARRRPLISFSIIWFLANMVIESTIIPLDLVFEHRLYLPSMFFFLPICAGIIQFKKYRNFTFLLLSCCLLLLGTATYSRNNEWKDPVSFLRKDVSLAPTNEQAHSNLGKALMDRGELDEAIKHFKEAIRLKPNLTPAYNNLGLLYFRQRRLADAVKNFKKALHYKPKTFQAHLNLGGIYAEMGNYQQSLIHLKEAVRLRPSYASAHGNLANVLQLLGRYDEAIFHYDKALAYNPQHQNARRNRQIAINRLMQKQQKPVK